MTDVHGIKAEKPDTRPSPSQVFPFLSASRRALCGKRIGWDDKFSFYGDPPVTCQGCQDVLKTTRDKRTLVCYSRAILREGKRQCQT